MNNYEENYKNGRTYMDESSLDDENLSTKSERKARRQSNLTGSPQTRSPSPLGVMDASPQNKMMLVPKSFIEINKNKMPQVSKFNQKRAEQMQQQINIYRKQIFNKLKDRKLQEQRARTVRQFQPEKPNAVELPPKPKQPRLNSAFGGIKKPERNIKSICDASHNF